MSETRTETTAEPVAPAKERATVAAPPEHQPMPQGGGDHGGVYSVVRQAAAQSGGQEPPPDRFSSIFRQADFAHPANDLQRARALSELQQNYGNRYVQRVLAPHTSAQTHSLAPMQRKAENGHGNSPPISPLIESSAGQPLDGATSQFMQSRFGHDFSGVSVHTDSAAQRAADSLNATAFTTGRDVYFNRGAYNPSSEQGRGLIAHELTHVVQQDQGLANTGPHGFRVSQPSDPLERQAEAASDAVMRGEMFPALSSASMPMIHRQAAHGASSAPAASHTPAASAAGGSTRPGTTGAAPAAGDFPITIAGSTVVLQVRALLDRALPGNKLPVPTQKLPSFRAFKMTEASLDLDDNKIPTGATIGVAVNIPSLDGQGTLSVDKHGNASGSVHVVFSSQKIPGIKQTEIAAQVKKDDLTIETSIDFDLPKVTGNLAYKYQNGKHSGKGKANYEGAKMKGSLEIILSEAAKISGSGMLEMELFKGLKGEAEVAVNERRDIQVKGRLSVPGQIELFPEKKYEKSFFNFERKFPLWGITVPVIDVNIGLFAEIHAGAGFRSKFGPGVLRDIALTGEFGTDPEAATEFGLSGEFFVPAGAEIVINVGGGIGLGLAIADITGGIEAVGVAGLYTALTVRPQFKYSGGKYSIGGMAELAGVAQAKFGINAFAKIDVGVWMFKGTVWRKDWALAEWIWNSGLNVALRANINYTLGDDFAPEINFETGQVDPEKFVKDVMPESGSPVPGPAKPPVPDKGSFTAEGAQGTQVAGAPGQAPSPPTPGAPTARTQAGTPGQAAAGGPEAQAAEVVRESEISEGESEVEETAAPRPAATGGAIHRHAESGSVPEDTQIALAASGHHVVGQSDHSEVEAAQVGQAIIDGAPLPRITARPPSGSSVSRHPIEHNPDEFPIRWPDTDWGAVHEGQVLSREDVEAKRAAFKPMRDKMRRDGTVPHGDHVHHKLPLFLGGQNVAGNFEVLKPSPHSAWHSHLRDQSHADHRTGAEETRNPESKNWMGKKFKIYKGAAKQDKARKKPE